MAKTLADILSEEQKPQAQEPLPASALIQQLEAPPATPLEGAASFLRRIEKPVGIPEATPAPEPTGPTASYLPGEVGQGEALARGALSGVTSGFDEELGAAFQAGLESLRQRLEESDTGRAALESLGIGVTPRQTMAGGKVYVPEKEALGDVYREARAGGRMEKERARRSAPKTYMAGEIGGAIAQQALLQGMGVPAAGPGGAAATGAAYGLGESEADLTQGELGQAALDTATGAALGLGGFKLAQAAPGVIKAGAEKIKPLLDKTGILSAVQKVTQNLDEGLKQFEIYRNIKATGAIQSDIAGYIGEGGDTTRLERIGEVLGEEKVIPFFGSKEEIGRRAVALQEAAEKRMGEIYGLADKTAAAVGIKNPFNYASLQKSINAFEKSQPPGELIENAPVFRKVKAMIAAARKQGSSFGDANSFKASVAGVTRAYSGTKSTTNQLVAADIERVWNDEIVKQMESTFNRAVPANYTDAILEALQKAKRNWEATTFTEAGKLRATKQIGNNPLGLTASVVGAPAVAQGIDKGLAGATATGLGLALGTEFLRRRGSAMAGQTARAIRTGAPKVAQAAKSTGTAIERLLTTQPAAFGRFAQPLVEAAKQSPQQLAVTDYTLANQNPEYRTLRDELLKMREEGQE